jgi:hypothetical protein
MKSQLTAIINKIIYLLKECKWQNKALWFEEKLDVINKYDETALEFITAITQIKSILAGMGSFTDLPLMPSKDSGLSEDEARIMQFDLAKKLDIEINMLLNQK